MADICGKPRKGGRGVCQRRGKCPWHDPDLEAPNDGRPETPITDDQVHLIETLAGLGLTQAQISECLPIGERRLRKRIADGKHPEIEGAYRRGRANDARTMAERHRDIAMGRVQGQDVPISDQRKALRWRLERQHGWVETLNLDHGGGMKVEVTRRIVRADGDDG